MALEGPKLMLASWMGWMGSLGIEWGTLQSSMKPRGVCARHVKKTQGKHMVFFVKNIPTKPKRTSSGDSFFYDTPLVLLDMVVEPIF